MPSMWAYGRKNPILIARRREARVRRYRGRQRRLPSRPWLSRLTLDGATWPHRLHRPGEPREQYPRRDRQPGDVEASAGLKVYEYLFPGQTPGSVSQSTTRSPTSVSMARSADLWRMRPGRRARARRRSSGARACRGGRPWATLSVRLGRPRSVGERPARASGSVPDRDRWSGATGRSRKRGWPPTAATATDATGPWGWSCCRRVNPLYRVKSQRAPLSTD